MSSDQANEQPQDNCDATYDAERSAVQTVFDSLPGFDPKEVFETKIFLRAFALAERIRVAIEDKDVRISFDSEAVVASALGCLIAGHDPVIHPSTIGAAITAFARASRATAAFGEIEMLVCDEEGASSPSAAADVISVFVEDDQEGEL